MYRTRFAIAACVMLGVAACTPTLRNHGYRYVEGEAPVITPGEDTRASLISRLGSPSTSSVAGVLDETRRDSTWYYISETREALAYQRSRARERRIFAVHFDAAGMVAEVEEYGLDDGRRVAVVDRETPTRGRELSLLEQLLGNIGRLPASSFTGEENLPGGAGGPRRQ